MVLCGCGWWRTDIFIFIHFENLAKFCFSEKGVRCDNCTTVTATTEGPATVWMILTWKPYNNRRRPRTL
jgi:hypothetical protein